MSDDVDLLWRYAASVPPPTADLLESTRSRLVEAIKTEPGTGRPGAPAPIRRLGLPAPRILVGAVAAILLLGLALPLALLAAGGPRPSEAPTWRLTGYLTQPGWRLQPTAGASAYRLTCSSKRTCFASSPDPCSAAGATSTGTNTCGPVSSAIDVSRDGGLTWTASLDPGGHIWMGAVSCSTEAVCRVLGFDDGQRRAFLFTTVDAGITWSSSPMPGPVYEAQAQLSCVAASDCVVLADEPRAAGGIEGFSYVTTDGGQSWASSPLPGTFRAYALQCLRGGLCIAGGQVPSSYRVTNLAAQNRAAIFYSTDGGRTWKSAAGVPTGRGVGSVSCGDAAHCIAAEGTGQPAGHSVVIRTDDGGRHWRLTGSTPVTATLESVSCATATRCWASGFQGSSHHDVAATIISSTDGGQTWTSDPLPTLDGSPLRFVGAVTCPDVSGCLALAGRPHPTSRGDGIVLSN